MITDYQHPTSQNDQRLDSILTSLFSASSSSSASKRPKPSVPKIPETDRTPHDFVEKSDGLPQEERQAIFLKNSLLGAKPLQMHSPNQNSGLGNSSPSLVIGSLLGIFIMYRVFQNYT
jgi:hypothetical protein